MCQEAQQKHIRSFAQYHKYLHFVRVDLVKYSGWCFSFILEATEASIVMNRSCPRDTSNLHIHHRNCSFPFRFLHLRSSLLHLGLSISMQHCLLPELLAQLSSSASPVTHRADLIGSSYAVARLLVTSSRNFLRRWRKQDMPTALLFERKVAFRFRAAKIAQESLRR